MEAGGATWDSDPDLAAMSDIGMVTVGTVRNGPEDDTATAAADRPLLPGPGECTRTGDGAGRGLVPRDKDSLCF